MKYLFTIALFFVSCTAFAQQQRQFIFIIRSKAGVTPSADAVQTNIKHWQEYMGNLAKNGKLSGGYRPAGDGITLTGADKAVKPGAYTSNGEVVSSFLLVNAADMNEAKQLAAQCPVFELNGSIEIRPVQNTAD